MVNSIEVTSRDEFIETCSDVEDNPVSDDRIGAAYDVWMEYQETKDSKQFFIVIPEWLSSQEFDARRPFLLGEIEFDDDSKGAVLYKGLQMIDVSIIEMDAYDWVDIDDVLEEADISDTNDYIDEPGMMWVPRSLSTVFEHR